MEEYRAKLLAIENLPELRTLDAKIKHITAEIERIRIDMNKLKRAPRRNAEQIKYWQGRRNSLVDERRELQDEYKEIYDSECWYILNPDDDEL